MAAFAAFYVVAGREGRRVTGNKHYIIPIFIPHYGCRHQCIFCNQKKITGVGQSVLRANDVQDLIMEGLSRITKPRRIEVAFYGGSFTALSHEYQEELLRPVKSLLSQGRIHAVRVSTRPDAITQDGLRLLAAYGVSIVELGAQSLDDEVLACAARGHTYQDIVEAAALLQQSDMTWGLQLMVGLPGEDRASFSKTAGRLACLVPDLLRIYPTLVLADTPLAALYAQGQYRPLPLPEAVQRAAWLKLICQRVGTRVIRTGLQATTELNNSTTVLAGPYHPAFGEMTDSYWFQHMVERYLATTDGETSEVTILYHPLDHSKLRGLKNSNLQRWQSLYPLSRFHLKPHGTNVGELIFLQRGMQQVLNIAMLNEL